MSHCHRLKDAQWVWRPTLWNTACPDAHQILAECKAMLSSDVSVFHDCACAELRFRQAPQPRGGAAEFGLEMDIGAFTGSYISLAIAIPKPSSQALRRTHLVRCDIQFGTEIACETYARLNVQNGPNTDQITQAVPIGTRTSDATFDLYYTPINAARIEDAWIDLIFNTPANTKITLLDVLISRHMRAEI